MRRIIAVTLVVPAILAAAENVKSPFLDRALTRGVTNDRPYLPTSRLEVSYQAARALVARNESLLMAGTLTSVPQSEISAVRAALDNEVRAAGSITEHERHQYEEAQRDLDALVSAMASIGLGVNAAPATLVQAPAVETPAAAPVEAPAAPAAAPVNEAPVETAPAAAPVSEKPAETAAPVEAPAAEKPAEAPAVEAPAAEKPADKPAETPATEAPAAEKPAEAPAVEAPAAEKPADKPAETPATEAPAAEKPADKPAEAPAATLPPE